jgi:hypothetical protein
MEGVGQQDVMFPKLRPRYEDEKKTDLETEKNKGDGKKAIH